MLRVTLYAALAASLLSTSAAAQSATREKVLAALPGLKALAEQTVAKGEVPGLSIAVVHRDQVVYLAGFGVRQTGGADKVDADTVFQLASLSKPLAATVVAALVGDGPVSWDSRISDIDPGFALHDPYPTAEVTIRDLFAHRSGLSGSVGNDIEELGYTQGEILHRLRLAKPAYSFRGGYAYSNFGLTEGALAAARVSGKDWPEAAEERLYKPLGMVSTSARYRDFIARPNRAALHVRIDGQWAAFTRRNADAQSPAGGASSSARDLAQWLRLELARGKLGDRQIVDAAALAETHIPVSVSGVDRGTGEVRFYALGWGVAHRSHGVEWSHAGAFSAGARTVADLLPDEQLGIVVLSNAFPTGVPEGLVASFLDTVFDGKPERDWIAHWNEFYDTNLGTGALKRAIAPYANAPAIKGAALPLAAYAGTYANDYVGEARIEDTGPELVLHLGPADRRRSLRHFNRDTFLYAPFVETPGWLSSITFTIGPDGKASEITIDDLNADGLGTLARSEKR
jgi:CubicO group peptidase (beta-lactamase class C family)